MSDLVKTDDEAFSKIAIMRPVRGGGEIVDPDKSVNYAAYLLHHHAFKGVFAYDEFSYSIKMIKCPEWFSREAREKFDVHTISDEDVIRTDYALQGFGMNGGIDKTKNAILVAAHQNSVNPAKDYFSGLQWDGKPRLATWLTRYCSAVEDDVAYLAAVGTKWLVGAVARVMEPGCKFDTMLIFEGAQGAGKSTALRLLATFGDEGEEREYFTDQLSLANADNKDELQKLAGILICEIAELDGFHKRENTFLKAFISRQEDTYRPPYGIMPRTFPRQFVLAGSYNPNGGIITDPTGARRYWFVKNGSLFDLEALRKDKNQLWAEAVALYKKGEKTYLQDDLIRMAAGVADKRRIIDEWTNTVLDIAANRESVEVSQILKEMGIEVKTRTSKENRRVGDVLRSAGWHYGRIGTRSSRDIYGWRNPKSVWVQKQLDIEIPLVPQPPVKDYDEVEY